MVVTVAGGGTGAARGMGVASSDHEATRTNRSAARVAGALAAAVATAAVLEAAAPGADLRAALGTLDFDPVRAALLTAWIATALAALLGAALSGRPWPAALAATALLAVTHVVPMAWRTAAQAPPVLFGTPERLDVGALALRLATILAVGLLAAAVAAAAGRLLAETVVAWAREVRKAGRHRPAPGLLARTALVAGLAASLALGATGGASLVRYGPGDRVYSATVRGVPVPAGRVELRLFRSSAMGRARPYAVYLPPGYTARAPRRYPVVYLLHGDPGGYRDWLHLGVPGILDAGIARGALAPTVVVLPDGNGQATAASQWANRWDGHDRIEDSVLELVALVDREYRTRPDRRHRLVGGLSEGGFGAANLAARHPDIFGTAVSLSGYFHAHGPVFGADPAARHANSPDELVAGDPGARSVRYVLVAGDRDPRYLAEARSFAFELDRLRVPNRLLVVSGAHEGGVWTGGLILALEQARADLEDVAT
jgi:enterochelin esterase-like enzyme